MTETKQDGFMEQIRSQLAKMITTLTLNGQSSLAKAMAETAVTQQLWSDPSQRPPIFSALPSADPGT